MPETAAGRPEHEINPGPLLLHPVAEPGRPGGRFGTVAGGKTAGNDTVRFGALDAPRIAAGGSWRLRVGARPTHFIAADCPDPVCGEGGR